MKKIIYLAAALAAMVLAGSCQKETLESSQESQTVTYTVQVPDAIATKAVGDDYELIYEVYREADLSDPSKSPIYEGTDKVEADGTATFALEFVKNQNFTVLFWAQNKGVDVYETSDLRKVTLKTALTANNENMQVFAGSDEVVNCMSVAKGNVELVRPIAQVRVGTTSESLKIGNTSIELNTSDFNVSGLSNVYNVATKAVDTDKSKFEYDGKFEYTEETVPSGTFDVGSASYLFVAMNYVGFAPKEGANVDVEFNINTTEGEISHKVTNVPVKANYRTNIVGNLITAQSDYNVSIKPDWEEEEHTHGIVSVSTASDLQKAIKDIPAGIEGNIKLTDDINLGTFTKAEAPSYGLTIPADKNVIIDLNGFTLSQTFEQNANYSMIQNDGNLTILDSKGNGKISYLDSGNGGNYISNTITNRGTLTVKSGSIENNSSEAMANVGYAYAIDSSIWGEAAETVTNIEGGTVKSVYSPLRVRADSQTENVIANISGGEIYGRIDHQMSNSKAGVKGTLNISGGTFIPYGIKSNAAIMVFGAGLETDASGIVLDVTGGTFKAPITISREGYVPLGQGFNEKFITGGKFTVDPSANLADGYYALKYDNEEYYSLYDNFDPANRTYTVNSKEELLRLSDLNAKWAYFFSNGEGTEYSNYTEQNGGKGADFYYKWDWTIKLTVDIDFEGEIIEPIDLGHRKCFDGQGHTIKNAKIKTSSDAGLFNAAQCGLKNLVIENVQVNTSDNGATAGILASSCNAGVENITIRNSSVYGGKYTGAVVGYGYSDVTNCSVTNCNVKGSYKCGGIIGYVCASNDQTRKVDNNTLTDCTIDFTGTLTDGKTEFVCGMVVGNYNYDGTCSNNTIDNMTTGYATGLIGRIEAGKNVTVTGTNFKVATTEALQAALDNATEGTTITLVPDVNYGLVYMGRPTKHNATVMTCETHAYTTNNAVAFKDHLSDGAYHTTPKYTTTLKNLTVVGAEGAKIAGLLATSGHMYGDNVYDYVLDVTKNGSGYYNTLNLSNVLFSNVDFTGKIDINTSDATSVYDGVTFDGCTFTTGGIASSNGASIRYYNEANNGNVKNIVVKNCSFTNSYQGVYVQKVNGVTVTDSKFDTTGHNAIAVQSDNEPVNMKNVVIKANKFNNINNRVIRFGAIGVDSNITIQNNTAVNSGDEDGEVMRAVSIAAGITTSISGNNWGEGKVVANDELKDK